MSESVETTVPLPPVRNIQYGAIVSGEDIDRETWLMDVTAREALQSMVGATINQFIYNAGPEGDLRVTITLEAL